MRLDATPTCQNYEKCEGDKPITLEVAKTLNVNKTNTLHQFDSAGIVGVQSPVGKVPIVFYVKETSRSGRRGILYYDDYDSVCFMFPEYEHADWCSQPYDMKYDKVETYHNDIETWFHRNHGIFELWASVWRQWYNGQVLYRPTKKIQNCVSREGYPTKNTPVETVKEKRKSVAPIRPARKVNHSCGCNK